MFMAGPASCSAAGPTPATAPRGRWWPSTTFVSPNGKHGPVAPDPDDREWPVAPRDPDDRFALLKDVPSGTSSGGNSNGFPPDLYVEPASIQAERRTRDRSEHPCAASCQASDHPARRGPSAQGDTLGVLTRRAVLQLVLDNHRQHDRPTCARHGRGLVRSARGGFDPTCHGLRPQGLRRQGLLRPAGSRLEVPTGLAWNCMVPTSRPAGSS